VDEGSAGVSEESLPQELGELGFVPKERSGNVDALSSDDDDFLACVI